VEKSVWPCKARECYCHVQSLQHKGLDPGIIHPQKKVAEESEAREAPFSGSVNSVGIQQMNPAIDYPEEDFDCILSVNVTGAFLAAKYACRNYIRSGITGSIVMVASMSGQIANRRLACTASNTSKSAVQQMCRSMA
jgi:NAD(P)-dependent dehydrogenase (short-subunit alcohol dehydrogenase family)